MAMENEISTDGGPSAAPTVPTDTAVIKTSNTGEKKHSKKRKKRERGQKAKMRAVTAIGEEPRERQLARGQVRQLDILRGDPNTARLPRKTRDLLARMKKFSGETDNAANQGIQNKTAKDSKDSTKSLGNIGDGERLHGSTSGSTEPGGEKQQASKSSSQGDNDNDVKQPSKKRKFDGMQPGENFAQFSARLRKESRQMIIDTARKDNHQREKKRAYHEKRKERAIRKKRRRRGDLSDSDVEDDPTDDWDEKSSVAHLPSYWQEILHNNGKPVSDKQRKRMQRREDQASDQVAFGEQAERPPQFSSLPVRRGRKHGV